ncbi:outer membrane lipoprotein-sorting protein [Psychrobium sp. 1_MG-2023]|uniref:outer membrane lipoprotein-sorting protein n=1 Tax=Psychrobium sp. 1_MG-2023 TaxID=3062624 RepID=UPI000C32C787|nr:outer membrane lipoprotein-sorting protein [Psychrobium sp. 1_MG-2023]MDP2561158.1 outer membrane lipoprotein-sorting protein [Psychrobium sp. 1_MG-2023]PKF55132.1 outer membrane lipoprotein-sorting protein [Alteromonadales bacterium alter-6D02]
MTLNPLKLTILGITLALTNISFAAEQTFDISDPAAKGLAIAQARKAADKGWQSSESQSQMILKNAQGDISIRKFRSRALEVEGDGDKGLTIFDTPRDIKGTAFLNFSHITKNDDQWLYLPALKRVKRISSRNKSGPFMGSEFAYEDLSSFEIEKYSFLFLRQEPCGAQQCHVIEATPTDRYSGYSKTITWLDTNHLRVHKIEFYDRKKSLLKTLSSSQYNLYKDQYWRAHQAIMVNHLTGKSTEIITESLSFDVNFSTKDFNKNSLKRIK